MILVVAVVKGGAIENQASTGASTKPNATGSAASTAI